MKLATGAYLNLFSEVGHDNYGLKNKYDIFILFPEYMSFEEVSEIQEDIIEKVENALKTNFSDDNIENASKIKEIVEVLTIDYDAQVIVKTY